MTIQFFQIIGWFPFLIFAKVQKSYATFELQWYISDDAGSNKDKGSKRLSDVNIYQTTWCSIP
jgi:hypothetical protein